MNFFLDLEKNMDMKSLLTAVALSSLPGLTSAALAKDSNTIEVESILDRLEKKLTDNESGGLTFNEKMEPATKDGKMPKPSASYSFQHDEAGRAGKTGASGPIDDSETIIKGLSDAVAGLETQVERLHADVQKARLKVIEDARVDNFVQMDAEFRGIDKATLRSLVVKIDGVEVYRAADAGGLWMPSSKLPLFAGPVPPGSHKLSIDAAVMVREGGNVPVSADVTRRMEKEFEFSMPDGKERRTINILIDAPVRADAKGSISMGNVTGTGSDEVRL